MKSLQKNFLYNVLYQILLVILPLITAPYISRTLGATAVGVYSYTYSVAYYFLLIAMLGIGNHGNRSIAAVRDDRKKLNKTFSSIYSLQVITFSIAILAYAIYLVLFVKDNRLIVLLQLIYVTSGLFDIGWLFFGLEQFKLTVARNTLIKISTVVSYAGVGFKTYSGLPFSYEIKKGRNGEYTKELWIDRREKSKSLAWSSVLLALKNIKGEVVDRPKALGDIRGVTYIYGMFYRFGLIDVPDEVKEKMGHPKDRKK